MQALLLAAGESSRFFPYNLKHKCLVPIAGEPIIVHTIRSVKRGGITDIILVVPNESDFQNVLGNGKKYGVKIRYVVYKNAQGSGETILKAAHLLTSDFFLVNSNHVEFDALKRDIDKIRGTNKNVVLLAKENPEKGVHGVLKIDGDKVLGIVEKPDSTKGLSNLAVVGIYFLTQDFLKVLRKEKSHHYSLESALNTYAKSANVKVSITTQQVLKLKYPWDLLNIKNYLLSKLTKKISSKSNVSKHAVIEGNVVISDGAQISENAVIKGPAYIGKNAFVGNNSLIRNGTDIEEGAVVGGYAEIKNSLILAGAKTHSGHLEDSVLGENSRIGAHFTSANVRLDRKSVKAIIKGIEVDSGLRDLGVMIGSNSHLGARVTTMPGVIIGNNSSVGPSTTVMQNVESDTSYYAEFKQIVSKKRSAPTSS